MQFTRYRSHEWESHSPVRLSFDVLEAAISFSSFAEGPHWPFTSNTLLTRDVEFTFVTTSVKVHPQWPLKSVTVSTFFFNFCHSSVNFPLLHHFNFTVKWQMNTLIHSHTQGYCEKMSRPAYRCVEYAVQFIHSASHYRLRHGNFWLTQ